MWMRLSVLLVGMASASLAQAEQDKVFRAGAFAMNVTPKKFPISVNGNMADRKVMAADDPLHARCLVLDDGKTKLALVVVDSCMLPRELIEDAKSRAEKRTGIPASNMLISATHTHSAPPATGVFQTDPDVDYVKYLTEKIAEGIEKAHDRLAPARVGWGSANNATQLFNRRWKREEGLIPANPFGGTNDRVQMNPGYQAKGLIESAGPVDPEVFVLAVQTKEKKPIALFANYSLHYVGGNPQLSGDYFAAFADRVAQFVGQENGTGPFVGIMSNGTSGDVNNVNFAGPAPKGRQPGEQIRVVADSVAKTAFEIYGKIEFKDHVTLAAAEKDIELGVRKPTAAEIERAKKLLDEQKGAASLKGMPAIYANETVNMAKYPDKVTAKLQALRIGELGITAIPCEVFTEIGLDIKKRSPLKKTFTVSLGNGYNGYLPTPAQHQLGGYETWRARSSYLEVEASPKILDVLMELLKQVAK
ncbi:MAG: neutral/alkaline non-lysosomal ceramidase N-terminal domain-containing protein [Planctomycetes bacterium]|nr:neutral/alkaline non-lysosomal ceramidase N-terminal domain-containing protein [Planctomycetota bacterium]